MNFFEKLTQNVSIKAQLFVIFVLVLAAILIPGNIAGTSLNELTTDYSVLSNTHIPIVTALEEAQVAGSRIISSTNELVLDYSLSLQELGEEEGEEGEEEEGGEALQITEAITDYTEAVTLYRTLAEDLANEDFELVEDVETAGQNLINTANEVAEMVEEGASLEEIAEVREEIEELEEEFFLAIDAGLEEENEEFKALENEVSTLFTTTTNQLFTVMAVLGVVIALAVFFIGRAIVKSVVSLRDTADAMQRGDLSARTPLTSSNEIGRLGQAFNYMAASVQEREQELQATNESLEQRVAERTADLKKARDEAVAARRMADENSRLKSEFLSTMSHELRTPLNAIEGFTSIMLSGMGIELSPRAEDMVKRVSANSKRLLQLINDFLDLSRIEAGRLELAPSPVSPTKLAESWRSQVSVLAEEKGVAFNINIDPELPHTLMVDEDALSKIGINLLGNAFKFTRDGSVTLTITRDTNTWEIAVADTGIGIPVHAREYIFEEFRQVDGSSKREFGGTGLGLSLVQKLSRAMGGRVSLESEVGEGSTFTVTLPLVMVKEEGVTA